MAKLGQGIVRHGYVRGRCYCNRSVQGVAKLGSVQRVAESVANNYSVHGMAKLGQVIVRQAMAEGVPRAGYSDG